MELSPARSRRQHGIESEGAETVASVLHLYGKHYFGEKKIYIYIYVCVCVCVLFLYARGMSVCSGSRLNIWYICELLHEVDVSSEPVSYDKQENMSPRTAGQQNLWNISELPHKVETRNRVC